MAQTATERDRARRQRHTEEGNARAQASMWVPLDAKDEIRTAMLDAGKKALKKWHRSRDLPV